MNYAVLVENLCKRFGSVTALDNVTFTVQRGEIYAIVGPNGAGKTTLLRVLVGLVKPDSGKIVIEDVDVVREPERVISKIAYVPDNPVLYGELKVEEYLRLVARLRGIDSAKAQQRIDELLERLNLKPFAREKLANLSRGNVQKVVIAAALLPDVPVIVLDEPFNSLDVETQFTLKEILRELRKQGRTIILTSHIVPYVEDLADRVLVLNRGVKVAEGRLEEVLSALGGHRLEEVLVKLSRQHVRAP